MATRRESVVLDLDDRLTPGLLRAAAAAGVLNRELHNLGGSTGASGAATRGIGDTEKEVGKLGNTAGGSRREIDRLSGRLAILGTVAIDIAPAFVGIGATAIPAIAGLTTEFGAVALGAGTAMLAFHGVGTALTAVNKAALDPTVTNLDAARLALDKLPPAAQAFTRELAALQPRLMAAQQAAAQGLFPGLSEGLRDLERSIPAVNRFLFTMGQTLGNLGADAAKSLTGPEWADFRSFVEREGPPALDTFARSVGNVVHGLGELLVATEPLGTNFSSGLLEASRAFDQWASSVSQTQGFQEFIAFVEQSGPEVADALAAIGNAMLAIVEAGAPLSGPVLAGLTAVANAIAQIGQSDIGTPIYATIAALATLSRVQSGFGRISKTSWATAYRGAEGYQAKVSALRGPLIKGGLAAAGLAVASTGVADSFGLANTATLALTGSLAGPWGAAAGAAVGLVLDFAGGSSNAAAASADLTATLNTQTGALTQNSRQWAVSQLQDAGVLEAAKGLGLNLGEVTDAALQGGPALANLNAELDRHIFALNEAGSAANDHTGAEVEDSIAAQRLKDTLNDTNGTVVRTRDAFQLTNEAMHGTAGSFRVAESAAESFRKEIEAINEILTHRSAARDYQAALDAVTASIKQNGRSLDITTEKGRNNQAALDGVAAKAVAMAQTLKGSNRIAFMQQARADLIDAAQKFGKTRAEAQVLADKLHLVDQIDAKPKITINTNAAVAEISAVRAQMDSLHDRNLHITVTKTTNATVAERAAGNAGGGTIPGQRQPYGDKVLSWMAPGEEVITNRHGEADQFRADRASGRIPHYAAGGTVGGVGGVGGPNDASKGDRAMRGLQHSIDALTKSVDADKQSRDDLRQKSQQLQQQVSGSFQSDLFAQTGVWGAGSSPNGILRSDIHDARAFRRALRKAHKRGLSGGAFQALAESGNLQAAQFEADQTRAQLRLTTRLFSQRRRAAGATGAYAATVRYGQQLADIQHTLHREHAELVRLRHEAARHAKQAKQNAKDNAHDTSQAINGAGKNATRRARHR